MAEGTDKVLSKPDKERAMSDTMYAQHLMKDAFPKERHGSVYAAQYAAFDYLRRALTKQITFRRARSIWEGAAKRIDAEEAEALKRAQIEEIRRERSELRARLARLEEAIAMVDASEAGAAVAAHRPSTRAMGRGNLS